MKIRMKVIYNIEMGVTVMLIRHWLNRDETLLLVHTHTYTLLCAFVRVWGLCDCKTTYIYIYIIYLVQRVLAMEFIYFKC